MLYHLLRLQCYFFLLLVPYGRHALQKLHPRWAVIGRSRRIIGTSIKRSPFRCDENIQRPATTTAYCLYCIHIKMVNIRMLLPIDLDTDKMLIHVLCNSVILETFMLHNMAPMTCGITNTHQYGLVF